MTTYPQRTLLRLYDATYSTYICTGVVIEHGYILEVKNNDDKKKETYISVEEWKASRITIDTVIAVDGESLPNTIISKTDLNGFIIKSGFSWTKWCLNIIYEGAPHLLKNEEVKNAFNNLENLLDKYKENFEDISYTTHKYYPRNMIPCYAFFGGCVIFKVSNDDVNSELMSAYKTLYDLINLDMIVFLDKKISIENAKKDLKRVQKSIMKNTIKIVSLESSLAKYKKLLESDNTKEKKLNSIINK
jgi:hypothetical protein